MKFRCMLIVGLVVLNTMALFAGETGKISGVVRDAETGEVLPGANVMIRSNPFTVRRVSNIIY